MPRKKALRRATSQEKAAPARTKAPAKAKAPAKPRTRTTRKKTVKSE